MAAARPPAPRSTGVPPIAGAILRALGAIATFAGAAVVALFLHLDLPTTRRVVATRVNAILAAALPGRVTLDRVGGLGTTRLTGIDARVEDTDGTTVLRLSGVSARLSTATLVRSLLSGDDVRVDVVDLKVERAEVNLDADPDGELRIVRAFVRPGTPASGGTSRGVKLTIRRALLAHASVRGRPRGAPPIDADLDALEGAMRLDPSALAIDVAHADVIARGVLVDGTVRGSLEAHLNRPTPHGPELGGRLKWTGSVGPVVGSADAGYDGGVVDAVVDVAETMPADVRALWPACPFTAAVSAHATARGTLPSLTVEGRAAIGRGFLSVRGPITLGDELRAKLSLEATSIDARALTPDAPSSDLSASGEIDSTLAASGAATSLFTVDFAGGTLGTVRLPPATIRGQASRAPGPALQITGRADLSLREPGARIEAALRMDTKGDSYVAGCDLAA